ncbi:MAG: hypothetical protein ACTSYI_17730 [Promethearchaeota archaeon]
MVKENSNNEMHIRKIKSKYQYDESNGFLKISIFPGRIFYIEIPRQKPFMLDILASLCVFADAVNYEGQTIVESEYQLPFLLNVLFSEFNSLYGSNKIIFQKISTQYKIVDNSDQELNLPVVLLSGGKDSTYQLLEYMKRFKKNEILALFISGTTINSEFLSERQISKRIAEHLNIKWKESYIFNADYSNIALNVQKRTIWRDILMIAIARCFGSPVGTGETYDLYRFTNQKHLKQYNRKIAYFSGTKLAFDIMEEILNASIDSVPDELTVYNEMKKKRPKLFKLTRSCYDPMINSSQICDAQNNFTDACRKCKTFHIYDLVDQNKKLTKEQIEFMNSDLWVGLSNFQTRIK